MLTSERIYIDDQCSSELTNIFHYKHLGTFFFSHISSPPELNTTTMSHLEYI